MDAWSFAHHQTICACKCPDCLMVGFSCWGEKASKPMAPVEQRRRMARVIRREFWLQKSFLSGSFIITTAKHVFLMRR